MKKILALPLLITLSSCALVDPQIPQSTDFEDAELRAATSVSESDKNSIRSSTHNFYSKYYMAMQYPDSYPYSYYVTSSFDIRNTPKDQYINEIHKGNPMMEMYFSFDDNYLEFICLGYDGIIRKVGNEYTTSGSYFNLVGSYFNADMVKAFYDTYANGYIYSFDMLEIAKELYGGNQITSTVSGTTQTTTISDDEWYKKLVCTNNNGNGNFSVALGNPITVKKTTTYEGTNYEIEYTIDSADFVFENHRLKSGLIHEIEKDILKSMGFEGDLDTLTLEEYQYNVSYSDCFK